MFADYSVGSGDDESPVEPSSSPSAELVSPSAEVAPPSVGLVSPSFGLVGVSDELVSEGSPDDSVEFFSVADSALAVSPSPGSGQATSSVKAG
ncbi:hypothetical protein CXR25_15255 [Brevibacterium aurantiacum]|uniref:Uncharacterized protein n=1 Tax=Brevibacterium aurantiacum TaxID=273384 RepID=A0A368M5F1_BREAU|nr:hypothetical protein [Brevibacterium aurantiacum]AZL14022.1 hypothetical protein CXR25_15255 [Brevibacterium aurantiacum]AZT98342.1 hypothetical protein CXR27_16125 [Brevibacterium aurantiacum]PCC57577.1 hypothetical protein CIK58_07530 [Brevibacterium aurantiacum]RCS92983.1 hypothetical protein CIK63_01790 [Brevibacterium aurantiacum]RCS95210.1 hypothetical protein CIK61_09780 [Brevibacterium aurantiacum]